MQRDRCNADWCNGDRRKADRWDTDWRNGDYGNRGLRQSARRHRDQRTASRQRRSRAGRHHGRPCWCRGGRRAWQGQGFVRHRCRASDRLICRQLIGSGARLSRRAAGAVGWFLDWFGVHRTRCGRRRIRVDFCCRAVGTCRLAVHAGDRPSPDRSRRSSFRPSSMPPEPRRGVRTARVWASHDSGPIALRRSPIEICRNARTMSGSNCVPAQRVISRRASWIVIGFLYERAAVITSNTSATATSRPAKRDVGARQAGGIARPVELLVVLADRPRPVAEPVGDRAPDQLEPFGRVGLQHLPFLGGRLARLAKDLSRHAQLADVVQQRCPADLLAVLFIEVQLLAEQVRERSHAFGVPSGQRVVMVERSDERQQLCGTGLGRRLELCLLQLAGELLASCRFEARPRSATARGRGTRATASAVRRAAAAAGPGVRWRTAQPSRWPASRPATGRVRSSRGVRRPSGTAPPTRPTRRRSAW